MDLYSACKLGDEHQVESLMRSKVDANTLFSSGESALQYACSHGLEKIVQTLINHGAHVECTALQSACDIHRVDIIQLLLENGAADSNAWFASAKQSALQFACSRGSYEVSEILLKYGADVNYKGDSGCSPLELTCNRAKSVIDLMGSSNALLLVYLDEKVKLVDLLLANGANVSLERNKDQLLFDSVLLGSLELFGRLVEIAGVDLNFVDDCCNHSALQVACKIGRKDFVKLLLDNGADPNSVRPDHASPSPLQYVCSRGCYESAELLIQREADVNAWYNYQLGSPLEIAVESRNERLVKLLLDHGACVNNRVPLVGQYPIFFAIKNKDFACCSLMLDHGFDVNLEYYGHTALEIVSSTRNDADGTLTLAKDLIRRIVRMKAEGTFVSEKNLKAITDSKQFTAIQSQCEAEIELLKRTKFSKSYLSHYDLLKNSDEEQLAAFVNNESIVDATMTPFFADQFPIYGDFIVQNLERGYKRKIQFNKVNLLFNYLSTREEHCLPYLPYVAVYKINSYLEAKDRITLTQL